MDPINRDFSEPAERVRLMACQLIGNYPAKEYHHYSVAEFNSCLKDEMPFWCSGDGVDERPKK